MNKVKSKQQTRERRQARTRAKISGTATRPRISVSRSLNHIYVQMIDDASGKTILSVKDTEVKAGKNKVETALAVGKLLAERATEKKIAEAVFDKGMFKYHGRVKAVADGAREVGLKI